MSTTAPWGLAIIHHTGFTYDGRATSSFNEARMTPLSGATQEVRSTQLVVDPNVAVYRYVDYFGTVVNAFDVQQPHERLQVTATSSVESQAPSLSSPLAWRDLTDPDLVDQYSEFLFSTPRTAMDEDHVESLRDLVAGIDLHEGVEAISAFVRAHVAYVAGATTVEATAQESWSRGEGVCQDIAHVTIGFLRQLGVPARYVSGYLYPDTSEEIGRTVAGQSHAWLEYYAGAWTGSDPTNGTRETERHIIVARGRDYDDVAPLKGIYEGPAASGLGVVVEMTRTR